MNIYWENINNIFFKSKYRHPDWWFFSMYVLKLSDWCKRSFYLRNTIYVIERKIRKICLLPSFIKFLKVLKNVENLLYVYCKKVCTVTQCRTDKFLLRSSFLLVKGCSHAIEKQRNQTMFFIKISNPI